MPEKLGSSDLEKRNKIFSGSFGQQFKHGALVVSNVHNNAKHCNFISSFGNTVICPNIEAHKFLKKY